MPYVLEPLSPFQQGAGPGLSNSAHPSPKSCHTGAYRCPGGILRGFLYFPAVAGWKPALLSGGAVAPSGHTGWFLGRAPRRTVSEPTASSEGAEDIARGVSPGIMGQLQARALKGRHRPTCAALTGLLRRRYPNPGANAPGYFLPPPWGWATLFSRECCITTEKT